jgi:hypothetical protein
VLLLKPTRTKRKKKYQARKKKNRIEMEDSDTSWILPVCLVVLFFLAIWALNYWSKTKHKKEGEEFIITYSPKDKHPWKSTGSAVGYAVKGVEGGTLNLKRNIPYKFTYASPAILHPFCFTRSNIGGITDKNGRIRNSPEIIKEGTTIITFGREYPDSFYYQSTQDARMGGIVNLVG